MFFINIRYSQVNDCPPFEVTTPPPYSGPNRLISWVKLWKILIAPLPRKVKEVIKEVQQQNIFRESWKNRQKICARKKIKLSPKKNWKPEVLCREFVPSIMAAKLGWLNELTSRVTPRVYRTDEAVRNSATTTRPGSGAPFRSRPKQNKSWVKL